MGDGAREVEVVRTYLQMESPADLKLTAESETAESGVRVELIKNCTVSFFRYLYAEVGRPYYWTDRLEWSDEQVRGHIANAGFAIWVMYMDGAPAGYFELQSHHDGSGEIAYFGLLPEFIGRGLGKYLLSFAVKRAWETGANRVWLHTCTLDDPAALPNYIKRGFRPFRKESYVARLGPSTLRIKEYSG